jgi:pimeloyl-ACP methyl ester carboxylesterase
MLKSENTLNMGNFYTSLHRFSSLKSKQIILFLNGTPFSHESYIPLIMNLVNKYTLYVYDIRGMGNSSDVKPLMSSSKDSKDTCKKNLQYYVDDMKIIVDYIKDYENVKSINLFGWSWGGLQACRYIQLYPNDINLVILTSTLYTPVSSFINFSEELNIYITNLKNKLNLQDGFYTNNFRIPKKIVDFNMNRWFYPEQINTNEYISSKKIVENANLECYKNTIDIIANIDLSSEWLLNDYSHIKVLMLKANQDTTPPYMDIIKQDMNYIGITVTIITNDGKHPFYIINPNLTSEYIDNFLN